MNGKQGLIMDAIRAVFGVIDWILYLVLSWTYEIFFDVSTVEFLSNETIRNFFSRIQLILGVFMVFKISVSILQAIVDPEKITDKNNGFSAYIKRIIICLLMLTLLIPRNIPNAKNEYEVQINNNGLLFGTLYSLQRRILDNNTLGKLILGTSNDIIEVSNSSDSNNQGNDQAKVMKEKGKEFNTTILKGFIEPNENCNNFDSTDAGKAYNSDSVDATKLLMDNINVQCSNHYYAYFYYPIVGGIVAAVFAVIFIGFSVDIAIRALKIAILRLLAPIPIISYLDPNQEKKGAFANWVKLLTATYLDLFIRLAIVYFVIFLISDIRKNGIIIGTETEGFMSALVYIVICIGLFFFAKQAPKFIKQVLGIQNQMSNIGLASILGTAGTLVAGGGLSKALYNGAASGLGNAQTTMDAQITGKPGQSFMENYAKYRDGTLQQITGDKNRHGGVMGAWDFASDKAMAKRYGLDEPNIKAAKDYTKAEEAKLVNITHDYEEEKSNRDYLRDQNTILKLSKYVNEDGSWKSEEARTHAYQQDRENATVHDKYIASVNRTNELYDRMVKQQATVEDYRKNTEDMKDAAKTFYGKDKPYTAANPATPRPDPGHESQVGSGGTQYSSLGVNSDFNGTPRP